MTTLHEPESNLDQRPLRRSVFANTNRFDKPSWLRFTIAAATGLMLLQGCTRADVRGTYDVEIEIIRSAGPIEGTLILSTGILDVPSLTQEDRSAASDWLESDTNDANSCFVLHAGSGAERTPQNVRVFDARIRGNEVALPIEIYRTPVQSLEIVSLQFFANTMGGDVVFHDRGQQHPGRIHGVRSGSARPQRCLDDLEIFRANLAHSLTQ